MKFLSLEEHWEERAKEFKNIPLKLADVDILIEFIKDLHPKTIFEAGCNYGRELKYLESFGKIYGLDFNKTMIKNAKSYIPNGFFLVGSASAIPYISSCFHFVYTIGLLSHVSPNEIKKVIKELVRVSQKDILLIEYLGTRSGRSFVDNVKKFTWIHDYNRLISVLDVNIKYNKKISLGTDLYQIILLQKKVREKTVFKEIPKKKKFWGLKIGKFKIGFDR